MSPAWADPVRGFLLVAAANRAPLPLMSLRVHNSLSRTLEDFHPLVPGQVRMYVCGITVYDLCHMGHLRMNMAFDVIYRWLRASGYAVTYVRNVTDIDDKIITRAVERGVTIRHLTEEMTSAMHEDFAAVGLLRPDHEPRATEYVPQMLSLIGRLEDRGLAYRAPGGDVNYAVRKFEGYGKLSGKSLDDLRAGERVAVDDGVGQVREVLGEAGEDAHGLGPVAQFHAHHAERKTQLQFVGRALERLLDLFHGLALLAGQPQALRSGQVVGAGRPSSQRQNQQDGRQEEGEGQSHEG